MTTPLRNRVQSRLSLRPAGVAFLVGLVLHAVDQAAFTRAGPVPILATAPVVAALCYLHGREATYGRLAALLAWGFVGSGLAVLAVYPQVVNTVLPRPLTGAERVGYDLAMFLWFVLALAGGYAVAARRRGRGAVVAVALAPVVQAAFGLLLVVLVETGMYA